MLRQMVDVTTVSETGLSFLFSLTGLYSGHKRCPCRFVRIFLATTEWIIIIYAIFFSCYIHLIGIIIARPNVLDCKSYVPEKEELRHQTTRLPRVPGTYMNVVVQRPTPGRTYQG